MNTYRRASVNLPSVVVLYATLSFSSRVESLVKIAGAPFALTGELSVHPRSRNRGSSGTDTKVGRRDWLARLSSKNVFFKGVKFWIPSCRFSSLIAESKEPAAACSPAREEF